MTTEFRLAAYGICLDRDRVLLAHYVSPKGDTHWTLPGGGVEHGEDPVDAVIREVAEETGCTGVVERLLGVDARVVRSAERLYGGPDLHSVGVFYQVRIVGGELRPEPNGETSESVWTPLDAVERLARSSLVDIGLALAREKPATGHVDPIPVTGLLRH
ncbi:NUDIX hydrolase [Actinoplanes rectilineatus]|uniref:NUDIX hydrolase n=1 Tax=Actinoplanes rectilineatus TaxID=113571 RepID=UPI0005F2A336|nr:NUDIX hydrolase [Actinoplanes rectilineatus]